MTPFACLAPNAVIANAVRPAEVSAFCRAVLALPAVATPVPLSNYLALLTLTLVFEAPVYGFLARRAGRSARSGAAMLLGANLATHPAVIYGLPVLAVSAGLDLGAMTLAQETFAVLVEAAVLAAAWRLPIPVALAGSLAANLFSWWLGVLVQIGMFGA